MRDRIKIRAKHWLLNLEDWPMPKYGKPALEEPRFWKSPRYYDLLTPLHQMFGCSKLDVQILRHEMCGANGQTVGVFEVLNKVKLFEFKQT